MENYTIPTPPADVFENVPEATYDVLQEGGGVTTFILERIEYPKTGGILVHVRGGKYPKKGFPFPEAIAAVNQAKRLFIESIKVLSSWQLFGLGFFFLIPNKYQVQFIEKVLKSYNRIALSAMKPYILKGYYLCPAACEIGLMVKVFLSRLGVSADVTNDFASLVSAIFEYDDAYRYRMQDMASETNKIRLLADQFGEFKRLVALMAMRENDAYLKGKIKMMFLALKVATVSKKVRFALTEAIKWADFDFLKLDVADIYWTNMRADYQYRGIPFEERVKVDGIPPQYKVTRK